MSNQRPKTIPSPTGLDNFLEVLSVISLILLIGLPLYYYQQLPAEIPRHFDAEGNPDGWSSKSIIWTLPAIGLVLYLGLTYLNRIPHLFNYPVDITPENAERQYRGALQLNRFLKTGSLLAFTYISWSTIRTALGKSAGLGAWFTPVFLVLIFGPILYYLVSALKK